jgi:hypothetical protein
MGRHGGCLYSGCQPGKRGTSSNKDGFSDHQAYPGGGMENVFESNHAAVNGPTNSARFTSSALARPRLRPETPTCGMCMCAQPPAAANIWLRSMTWRNWYAAWLTYAVAADHP